MKKETLFHYALAAALLVLILIGNIAALTLFGHGSWDNRVGLVLSLVGFYGIGMGFVQKSDVLKNLFGADNPNVVDEMASPNPLRFLRANLFFFAVFGSLFAVAFGKRRTDQSSGPLGCFGQIILTLIIPLLLVYFLLHFLVLMPFAYIGYLVSSALVESVLGSKEDILLDGSYNGRLDLHPAILDFSLHRGQMASVREIVASNSTATKSFLLGIPAIAFSLVIKGIAIFIA